MVPRDVDIYPIKEHIHGKGQSALCLRRIHMRLGDLYEGFSFCQRQNP